VKNKPNSLPAVDEAATAFASSAGQVWKTLSSMTLPPLAQLQTDYLTQATELWNQSLQRLPGVPAAMPSAAAPVIKDRRFASDDWMANPGAAYTAQMYLLNARTLLQMADQVQGEEKTRQRIRFAVQQWIDMASPSNYLALNPEAQRLALETKGESLTHGLQHLWNDVRQGHLSQTDESLFEVGRNVATTGGSVVFENELFQLLEYKPLADPPHRGARPPCVRAQLAQRR